MLHSLSDEIKEFHARIRAKALLIAIEWAGSAAALAELLGYDRFAGTKWLQRGRIPGWVALRMAKLEGFPLSASELCPGEDLSRYTSAKCPHCKRQIEAPSGQTGCSPLLKVGRKRAKKRRVKAMRERASKAANRQQSAS